MRRILLALAATAALAIGAPAAASAGSHPAPTPSPAHQAQSTIIRPLTTGGLAGDPAEISSNDGQNPYFILHDHAAGSNITVSTVGEDWVFPLGGGSGTVLLQHQGTNNCVDYSTSTNDFISHSCNAGAEYQQFYAVSTGGGTGHYWYINRGASGLYGSDIFLTEASNSNGSVVLGAPGGAGNRAKWVNYGS